MSDTKGTDLKNDHIKYDWDDSETLSKSQKAFLTVLASNLGNVSDAARQTGLGRRIHYKWLEASDEYKGFYDEINDIAIDFVEGKLQGNINNGDVVSILFYLKTKGKKRGYVEKQEMEFTKPIPTIVDWQNDPE